MTYKDIVFEMFESATAELEKGNIYSANVLLWACHELFEQANRIDKSGHFDWLLDLWFAKFTNEQIMQAFNQLKEEYPLAKEFETFDDFKQQIKEILIKRFPIKLGKIETTFKHCYDVYTRCKHGPTSGAGHTGLDTNLKTTLDPQTVEALHAILSYYIDSIYTKDIIEKYGLEYMDKKYGIPKN